MVVVVIISSVVMIIMRVVLLIFRISKFRNMCFIQDLILNNISCEFYCDDVYCEVIYKCQKVSHKEQHSVIRFRWAKGLGINAIQSEMHPVYDDKCFTRQQYMFGVKSLFMVEKVLLVNGDE